MWKFLNSQKVFWYLFIFGFILGIILAAIYYERILLEQGILFAIVLLISWLVLGFAFLKVVVGKSKL